MGTILQPTPEGCDDQMSNPRKVLGTVYVIQELFGKEKSMYLFISFFLKQWVL